MWCTCFTLQRDEPPKTLALLTEAEEHVTTWDCDIKFLELHVAICTHKGVFTSGKVVYTGETITRA